MKVRLHLALLLALAVIACSLAAAPMVSAAPAPAPAAKAAAKQGDEASAAERRAASSEFEREKLDPDAFAQDDESKGGGSDEAAKKDSGGSLFRFLFGLVVVLAVIYGVHWLLKRWGQSRMQGMVGSSGIIDVVATTPLAQGRALHVVRVGQELVLVGATEQSITRITDLDASLLGGPGALAPAGGGEFATVLDGALIGTSPARAALPSGAAPAANAKDSFAKRFIENLRLSTAR